MHLQVGLTFSQPGGYNSSTRNRKRGTQQQEVVDAEQLLCGLGCIGGDFVVYGFASAAAKKSVAA
jgi:hypothetical protein